MYSTLDGAKKRAKTIKNLLSESGLLYALSKCQQAVAVAGGFPDWHQLTVRLQKGTSNKDPYDFWGNLLSAVPEPCRAPIQYHLNGDNADDRLEVPASEKWIRDVVPYAIGLERVLRSTHPYLRPGVGDGQRIRLEVVSSLLLNGNHTCEPGLYLKPDCLTVVVEGEPATLLPDLVPHPRFSRTITELAESDLIRVEDGKTHVLAPADPELRSKIIEKAQDWKRQSEPKVEYIDIGPELSALMRRQGDIDRAEAGPKVPYDELDYKGVTLESRWSVAAEFMRMRGVVDDMPADMRIRVGSISCDSKAEAIYCFVIKLGMNYEALAYEIQQSALRSLGSYNGLVVRHGNQDLFFNPDALEDDPWYPN